MNEFLENWVLLVAVFSLAVISPGPDFVMAVRNSVRYSRIAGIFTAIGFGAGVAIHVVYCLAGLALVISQSVLLFNIIKFVGAGYLFYVGCNVRKGHFWHDMYCDDHYLVFHRRSCVDHTQNPWPIFKNVEMD